MLHLAVGQKIAVLVFENGVRIALTIAERDTLVSNDPTPKASRALNLQVPNFGQVSAELLDAKKGYRCHVYRMSDEMMRAVSEHTSFAANFDSPSMRTALMDLWKNQGTVVIEIERNAKPKEISVRYPKERWTVLETLTIEGEGLKPSIKTEYGAVKLASKVFSTVAKALNLPPDMMPEILLRINLKEKTFAVIAEEWLADKLPPDAKTVEAVAVTAAEAVATTPIAASEATEATIDAVAQAEEMEDTANKGKAVPKSKAPQSVSSQSNDMDQKQKYATYSRSEVDQLLKQQAEQLAATLGTKISQQQRAFQEAMEKQEKSFGRMTESMSSTMDTARTKLESAARTASEQTNKDLEDFKRQLGKELENYRTQINKASTREVTKPSTETLAKAEKAPANMPSPAGPVTVGTPPARDQVVMALLVAAIVAAMVNMITIMLSVSDVKEHLVGIEAKLNQMAPPAAPAPAAPK